MDNISCAIETYFHVSPDNAECTHVTYAARIKDSGREIGYTGHHRTREAAIMDASRRLPKLLAKRAA